MEKKSIMVATIRRVGRERNNHTLSEREIY